MHVREEKQRSGVDISEVPVVHHDRCVRNGQAVHSYNYRLRTVNSTLVLNFGWAVIRKEKGISPPTLKKANKKERKIASLREVAWAMLF